VAGIAVDRLKKAGDLGFPGLLAGRFLPPTPKVLAGALDVARDEDGHDGTEIT